MIGFRTGSDARLQVTFRDNSVLTLGEKANVIVDRNVFDPEKSKGEEKRLTNNFRDNLYNQYLDRESTGLAGTRQGTNIWRPFNLLSLPLVICRLVVVISGDLPEQCRVTL